MNYDDDDDNLQLSVPLTCARLDNLSAADMFVICVSAPEQA